MGGAAGGERLVGPGAAEQGGRDVGEGGGGAAVAVPDEQQEEGGDEQRGEFEPVLEGLHEGDGAHPAGGDGEDDDGGDDGAAEPAGRAGEQREGQPGALELRDEVEPAGADHEHRDEQPHLP